MPPLCGDENIRDFIACVTHAMLADIIHGEFGQQAPLRRTGRLHDISRPSRGPQASCLALTPTPLEQEGQISLETLQIIFNPFGINAC
jgi:hypothetical protein